MEAKSAKQTFPLPLTGYVFGGAIPGFDTRSRIRARISARCSVSDEVFLPEHVIH
jgi:hypothetical protein